jgi:hypothetical protein
MAHVIAERMFDEAIPFETLQQQLQQGHPCYTAHRVRHLRTLVAPDGRRMICEYEAPDAETVRSVSRQLGVPYERVWTAGVIETGGTLVQKTT